MNNLVAEMPELPHQISSASDGGHGCVAYVRDSFAVAAHGYQACLAVIAGQASFTSVSTIAV
ncbi:hypothetical protein [Undibacterium sp. Ji49W]|uniref:hypothetical protein n=1 Tax=Undibacterium sp. Ji49W TaxID=3413040 RepID=UPI003BF2FF12